MDVELQEFSVAPDPESVPSGEVTFEVSNTGKEEHEFVVIQTDSDPADLPTKKDGSVDEDEVDVLGEVEALESKESGSVKLDLEPGAYALICNVVDKEKEDGKTKVESHYKLGMRTAFTVE